MATQLTDEELFSVLDADHTFETKAEAGSKSWIKPQGLCVPFGRSQEPSVRPP